MTEIRSHHRPNVTFDIRGKSSMMEVLNNLMVSNQNEVTRNHHEAGSDFCEP